MQKESEEKKNQPNFGLDLPYQRTGAKDRFRAFFMSHYFWVFILGIIINSFIFRGVLASWYDIIQNKVIVGPEELVPIFNFQSQYLDQQANPFSALTTNFEFRVRYSILTTWTRYYNILPGTIVLFCSLTLLLIYTAIYRLLDLITSFSKEKIWKPILYTAALSGSFLSIFILIYSKITHFYTLIFGFGLFSLAVCLLIEYQVKFYQITKKQAIAGLVIIVLLNLFNPATHYVILFIFIAGLMCLIEVSKLLYVYLKGHKIKDINWNKFIWIFLTMIISILTYLAYYYFFVTSSNQFVVSDIVNITRRIVTNASSSIEQILSLQTGAILDFHNFADYQIEPGNRIYSAIYSAMLAAIGVYTFLKSKKSKDFKEFSIWIFLAILWLISVFFALGYGNSFSAHNTAGWLVGRIYNSNNIFSNFVFSGISVFFQILRFPHRFIFIFQLVNSIGLSLFLFYILKWLDKVINFSHSIFKWVWLIVILSLSLTPYLIGNEIGKTLASGDLNQFIAPYHIPQDLKTIKEYLSKNSGGKMAIMPSTEIPLRVTGDANGTEFKLIDKFFIYYLDYPTQYYGLGTDTNLKNLYFTIYNQINQGLPWFNQLKNQDIEYILVNKNQKLKPGYSFRSSLEEKINQAIDQVVKENLATKVVEGKDFDLIRLNSEFVNNKTSFYFNESWQELQNTAFRDNSGFSEYTLSDISRLICLEKTFVAQSDLSKITKDLYFLCEKKGSVYNSQILPFKSEIESTDDYSSTVFSLFTTTESPVSNRFNSLESINPGTFGSLNKRIVFLTEEDLKINIPFQIDNTGNWNIDFRAKISQSVVVATILNDAGKEIKSVKLDLYDPKNILDKNGTPIFNNFAYFNLIKDLSLNKGKYNLSISKFGTDPIAIDGVLAYNEDALNNYIETKNIKKLDYNLYKFETK
jgi:hypothetical protein